MRGRNANNGRCKMQCTIFNENFKHLLLFHFPKIPVYVPVFFEKKSKYSPSHYAFNFTFIFFQVCIFFIKKSFVFHFLVFNE